MKLFAPLALVVGLLPAAATARIATSYPLTPDGNAQFLADFAAEPDVTKFPDGLMYKVINKGDGRGTSPLARQDIVTVEYRGWMINGTVFDQTKPYEPRTLQTGNLIKGWSEALYKMKSGQEWLLVIPAALAYGADGRMPVIPPNQTLIFQVKLEKVEYP
jgi:FKBP-type peptidyl-prolyl cis-trans isomerase